MEQQSITPTITPAINLLHREVLNAEKVFKALLSKEMERKPTFCEAYYLWPMADVSRLTKFKSEFEKECESAKFFFYATGDTVRAVALKNVRHIIAKRRN